MVFYVGVPAAIKKILIGCINKKFQKEAGGYETGSGGRELGKRLAEALQIPCCDNEIIEEVAKLHNVEPEFIEHISEADIRLVYPVTIGRRFNLTAKSAQNTISVLVSQQNIIKKLAVQGDCVIVGRCADLILQDMKPLNLFVYADKQSKLQRCQQRVKANEKPKDIIKLINKIDRERAAFRELWAESRWGYKENYHLCINTSRREIKSLIPALALYAQSWQ